MGLRSALRKLFRASSSPSSNETPIDIEKKQPTTTIDEVSSILSSSTTKTPTSALTTQAPTPLLTIHCACGNSITFTSHSFSILGRQWHIGSYSQNIQNRHYTSAVVFRGNNISWSRKAPNEVNVTCENKRKVEVVVKKRRKVGSVRCKGCRGWKVGVWQRSTLMRTVEGGGGLRERRNLWMEGKSL